MTDMMIKNTGLLIPDDCTEEQFFEWGKELAKIEQGMQWAIGDWYNKIPWGDKKAACEKVGLNANMAQQLGFVASKFQIISRNIISGEDSEILKRHSRLTFEHHKRVLSKDLTTEQMQKILDDAALGHVDDSGKPMNPDKDGRAKVLTVAQMLKLKNKALGKESVEKDVPKDMQSEMEKFIDGLPKQIGARVRKKIRWFIDQLNATFWDQVNEQVAIKVKKRFEEKYAELAEREKTLERQRSALNRRSMTVTGLMTQDEFGKIRGLLHPDRYPDDMKQRAAEAFRVFNGLKDTIDPGMSKKDKQAAGWK